MEARRGHCMEARRGHCMEARHKHSKDTTRKQQGHNDTTRTYQGHTKDTIKTRRTCALPLLLTVRQVDSQQPYRIAPAKGNNWLHGPRCHCRNCYPAVANWPQRSLPHSGRLATALAALAPN
eukprot:353800-Chlamydomonas_euryale.AAC.1